MPACLLWRFPAVNAESADHDYAFDTGIFSGLGDILSAFLLQLDELLLCTREDTDQGDDGIGSLDGGKDGFGLSDIDLCRR